MQELASPGKERALLSTVGKPTDRGHVESVLIFLLAVVKGFHVFLWLSLVGVQLHWLLQLWLIRKSLRPLARS